MASTTDTSGQMQRFRLALDSETHKLHMDPDPEGGWVRFQDVRAQLQFWGGYLDSHCAMLERYKVHPQIIEAVRKMQKEFERE